MLFFFLFVQITVFTTEFLTPREKLGMMVVSMVASASTPLRAATSARRDAHATQQSQQAVFWWKTPATRAASAQCAAPTSPPQHLQRLKPLHLVPQSPHPLAPLPILRWASPPPGPRPFLRVSVMHLPLWCVFGVLCIPCWKFWFLCL